MHITINRKSGRIYLPKEVVDFIGTDSIEITSDDNYFSINERMWEDDGIRINKDNVIQDRAVVQWLTEQYDFPQAEKIVLDIMDLRTVMLASRRFTFSTSATMNCSRGTNKGTPISRHLQNSRNAIRSKTNLGGSRWMTMRTTVLIRVRVEAFLREIKRKLPKTRLCTFNELSA